MAIASGLYHHLDRSYSNSHCNWHLLYGNINFLPTKYKLANQGTLMTVTYRFTSINWLLAQLYCTYSQDIYIIQ